MAVQPYFDFGAQARRIIQAVSSVLLGSAFALAQTGSDEIKRDLNPDSQNSRAERHADEMVALSADTILGLLRKEPNLLLQAKRALVRKAYQQGRLVDAKDLDDDAFFRLIAEDQSVRVLITHEIEKRNYTRAHPPETVPALSPDPPALAVSPTAPARGIRRQVERAENWSFPDEVIGGPKPTRNPRPDTDEPTSLPPGLNAASLTVPDLSGGTQEPHTYGSRNQNGGSRDQTLFPPRTPASDLSENSRNRLSPTQSDGETESQRERTRTTTRIRTGGREGAVPDPQRLRHRTNPAANVPSLYDLYAQYSGRPLATERFGADVFHNGTGNFDDLPMDMPVGPEYVLGPGDGVSIELWGGVSQRLQRVVDREGRVALPEVGMVQVSGRSLGDVQHLMQKTLRTQFRDLEVDVSLSRLRTVRVYVVGDVESPGAYDVSSLSTPLNALYLAGGPNARGSLRTLRHFRGSQLVQEIDVYDLLLRGVRSGLQGRKPGDTILIPPRGAEVTVTGMVRRPFLSTVSTRSKR